MRDAPETAEIATLPRPSPAMPLQPARSPEPPIIERPVLETSDAVEQAAVALDRNPGQRVDSKVSWGVARGLGPRVLLRPAMPTRA